MGIAEKANKQEGITGMVILDSVKMFTDPLIQVTG